MVKETFEDAFISPCGSCRTQCACGKEFYDIDVQCVVSWERGEYEALVANPDAIGIDHNVEFIEFEGQVFVSSCDCWHARADRLIAFIDGHASQIAKYLNAERQRKIHEAESVAAITGVDRCM